MKSQSIKLIISALVIIATTFSYGQQDFQGKAYYFSKTTMDMGNFGGREMSPDMKKRIEERMKSMFEKTFILTFNKEESIYKEEEKLEAPGGGGMRFGGFSMTGGDQYKNVKENKLLIEQEFFGKQFLINDELKKLDWVMTAETKQIGKYMAMKATAVVELDNTDFMSARRRDRGRDNADRAKASDSTKTNNPMDEIEIPKTQIVTAWYTPQIPINQGPGEYWGLPGLILEVSAGRTVILCSKIVMNPGEKEEIKRPSKGKEVNQKEYSDIVKEKMEEMVNMRGRGRPGGGRRN
ncbi:GLPGLI family protein [Flavobacteriaceae bacterium S0825]|uniref:GLPGLI family protein n=1 Tax=Gaetbulibacter sp. S0825 TaxID=2720084 RepID=UPI001430F119|nr:GLPGLI family protein [Gaetbulibacter sp. S0825]MCK0108590.1 GLPGLI family protein [Flavobacteriaceae bacterium S0825]NIX64226.1 GLPGLI family protein [Gaetbulibacter sp. S0825]